MGATSPQAALTAPFELGFTGPPVLLIHGFTGTPWDLRPMAEALADAGYRVRVPRLPGHGLDPLAMEDVRATDWRGVVESELLRLSARGPVHVVGLSMGALLGSIAAGHLPGLTASLTLLAPALRLAGVPERVVAQLSGWNVLPSIHPWLHKSGTDIRDPETRLTAPLLRAYPRARLGDLVRVQAWARRALPQVRCPVLVIDSAKDRVIHASAAGSVVRRLRGSPRVRTLHLKESGHVMTRDLEHRRVEREVLDFLRGLQPVRAPEQPVSAA
ncbi:MAG TPA: alpha/beta fold hydrolase [Myxococcaceae bacterium]|nr:alpha/beta fold hydrolase [Myxococcaceae bacterium]